MTCIQADLMDISRFKHHNSYYTFLLNIVVVDSRYAFSFPLKTKKPSDVVIPLKKY